MKKILTILTALTLTTGTSLTTSSIIGTQNNSNLLLNQESNINKNVYTMIHKEVTIDGKVFNSIDETYLLYLNSDIINHLINIHDTVSLKLAVATNFIVISTFHSFFNPSEPKDWFDIKSEISALLYRSIQNSKSETGSILQFKRVKLTPEMHQDWTLVNIQLQDK